MSEPLRPLVATRELRRYKPMGFRMEGNPPTKVPIAQLEIVKPGERCDWAAGGVYEQLGWVKEA